MRLLQLGFVAALALFASAAPAAAASPGGVVATTPIWTYWLVPFLFAGFLGLLCLLGVGYYLKVFRPKYRGR